MSQPVYLSAAYRVPPRACPTCRRELDGIATVTTDPAALAHDPAPAPGDVTVCLGCATALVYTDDALRVASDADLAACGPDVDALIRDYQAWRARAETRQ